MYTYTVYEMFITFAKD